MLEGLDAVDWSGLTQAYGTATDLPGLLRQAAAESAEEAEEALGELYGCIMHQAPSTPRPRRPCRSWSSWPIPPRPTAMNLLIS